MHRLQKKMQEDIEILDCRVSNLEALEDLGVQSMSKDIKKLKGELNNMGDIILKWTQKL